MKSDTRQKKTDEHIADLTVGDDWKAMLAAWQACESRCHIFAVGPSLFARGSLQEREFAKGFLAGWRSAKVDLR